MSYDHELLRGCCNDELDPLENKKRGFCPWCGVAIDDCFILDGSWHGDAPPTCGYDEDMTEDENRIRYASEFLANAKVESKV